MAPPPPPCYFASSHCAPPPGLALPYPHQEQKHCATPLTSSASATEALRRRHLALQQPSSMGALVAKGGSFGYKKPTANKNTSASWWKSIGAGLVCPVSNFPIDLLPYPPFKLRLDKTKPNQYKLVDGEYLALQVVATRSMEACGGKLTSADIKALDEYMHRCKLAGPRPGRACALAQNVESAVSEEDKLKFAKELQRVVERAREKLTRLQRIQETRLADLESRTSVGSTASFSDSWSTASSEDS